MTRPVALPEILAQMPVTIPSAALRQMTEDERRHVLAFDSSPEALANYLAVLDARLRVFERRYELPTSALRDALGSGKLRDTAEVSEWMFLAELRSDLAREARPQPAR